MANHPSAEKRNRQRVKRTAQNRTIKSAVRTEVKKATAALTEGKDAATAVKSAQAKLAKAAAKGAVHEKAASRKIGRLAKALHKASAKQ